MKPIMSDANVNPDYRIAWVAGAVLALDQLTKLLVLRFLGYAQERVVLDGFFKFVHWGNTGAAWNLFYGNNHMLAIVSLIALLVLFLCRHRFDAHLVTGQLALGFMFGGICGNLVDRLLHSRQHVIDFIYFHLNRRDGGEMGFPAFNVADAAICTGVALLFLLSWRREHVRLASKAEEIRAA